MSPAGERMLMAYLKHQAKTLSLIAKQLATRGDTTVREMTSQWDSELEQTIRGIAYEALGPR